MKIIGIYYIKSIKKDFYYIGKSVDIKKRRIRHFSELRRNKHSNEKMQRHFLKYGEKDFEHGILEQVSFSKYKNIKNKLTELEIYYIKKYNSFKKGFNLTTGGEGLGGCGVDFSLKNLETKEIKSFNSLREACFFIGCSSESSVHAVLSGKCNTCKGWARPDDDGREIRTGTYSKNFILKHPIHGIYEGSNQSAFKRKFNIKMDVSSLILGKRKSCGGWVLV